MYSGTTKLNYGLRGGGEGKTSYRPDKKKTILFGKTGGDSDVRGAARASLLAMTDKKENDDGKKIGFGADKYGGDGRERFWRR